MPSFAMKVYDRQWHATFGMSPDEAAARLVADGIDTVLCANRIDPLPTSGVDQERYLSQQSGPEPTDAEWTAALRRQGLTVLQTSAMFFDPPALSRLADAVPINAAGEPDPGIDWYRGVCPSHSAYLAEKMERLRRVATELTPDGLFLQFIRYPGFWEQWTVDPEYTFADRDRYCFCPRCVAAFSADQNSDGDLTPRAILERHGDAWDAWRARRIANVVGDVRAMLDEIAPGASLMLNTLPFAAADFGGADVRRTIAAQDIGVLSDVVDRFELMTYLQILKRPPSWIGEVVADARAALAGATASVVCTLQVDALYTDGVHAERRRSGAVTARDLLDGAEAALSAGSDGLVFYHWTDFLTDEAARGAKRDALRRITGA